MGPHVGSEIWDLYVWGLCVVYVCLCGICVGAVCLLVWGLCGGCMCACVGSVCVLVWDLCGGYVGTVCVLVWDLCEGCVCVCVLVCDLCGGCVCACVGSAWGLCVGGGGFPLVVVVINLFSLLVLVSKFILVLVYPAEACRLRPAHPTCAQLSSVLTAVTPTPSSPEHRAQVLYGYPPSSIHSALNNNKRPLTPKSMPPNGDEHAKLKT